MSHIFDALQRSEAEANGRGGLEGESSTLPHATELLQLAERKMRAQNAATDLTQMNREQGDRAANTRAAMKSVAVDLSELDRPQIERGTNERREADRSESGGRESGRREMDHLDLPSIALEQFPSLSVSIAPSSRLVSVGAEESLGAEKFRFLAVKLRQMRQSRPLKKILITSTIPQEGKSTVAANLACTLARRKQHKTLLLEGDLRRPTAAEKFGLGRLPGLCEWLSGQAENINLYRLESLGFWILPAGSAPENPLELMQSGKMANLMLQLEAWFDWIVIDSPPVLPLADASIWSRMADGILLVTRRGVTEKQQLQRGLEAIERSKLLGALVNSSSNAAHSDYYQRYTSEGDRSK